MPWYKEMQYFFTRNWHILSFIILLIISFTYFTFLQAVPTFADPDSFYHVKAAMLIPEEGLVKTFPWLQFTVLKDSYIDQHFLYHVFLVPFTQILDPIQGAKLANIILTVGLVLLFYWFLRAFKVKFAFIFTVILLISTPFIFRINLVKAPAFSIIFLILSLYFILKHKRLALYILSFIYVWAYGGFILILVFSGIYAGVSLVQNWWRKKPNRSFLTVFGYSQELRLFFISALGTISGLVVNPYFPENLTFYWHQLVKIGIINYQSIIPVGNEWYPYKFIDLTANTAFVSIIIIVALYLFVVNYKKPSRRVVTAFIIYVFFFLFTLKSRRYVEYYVPFAIIFAAFALNHHLVDLNFKKMWSSVLSFHKKYRKLTTILLIYFIVTPVAVVVKDVRHTYHDFKNGIELSRFSQASAWLMENSQPGEIVFHSSWDEFPILFYFNSHNYYIAGLDPTFSYEYNPELYKKMVDITLGDQRTGLYNDIKNNFQAAYILVEKNHQAMNTNVRSEQRFLEVYSDNDATIYQVR